MTVWPRVRIAALLVVAAGCAARATPPSAQAPVETAGRDEAFRPSRAVRWVRDSPEHRALFLQVYRSAAAHVEAEAATREHGTWAVVSDADETLIDNSLYQLERQRQGLEFTPESWRAWTERREAVLLPGARAFLGRVRELGGRIVIITNRREAECPDTRAVFEAHGLDYDAVLCRPDDGPGDKTSRFRAVRQGTTAAGLPPLEIVAFLGDNILDFPAKGRDEGTSQDFGKGFFVLPNPMYGGWE